MDVTDPAGWDRVHSEVMEKWGCLHVLVNNAGVAAAGDCAETSMEDWAWIVDVDLMGVVRGCHRMLPVLRKTAKEDGTDCWIVNVASFAGLACMPGVSAYGTAKAAVIALSEQLRAELHGSGVGVTVVCPAFVKTRLMENFRFSDPASKVWVEKQMARSDVTAQDVADQTVQAIRNRRFMVLTHPRTRAAWRLKRWFPEFYFRQICKAHKSGSRSGATEQRA
jgi:NADP-dependent 3-hydroxy acid dehydrogenase YdfG